MVCRDKMIRMSLKLALVALMAVYPGMGTVNTANAAAKTPAIQSVFAKTGTLDGVLTGSGGKPVSGVKVWVLDSAGKKVGSAVTDKAGKFSLANLKPGQYRLLIGKDVELKLTVADNGVTTNLKVVLPTDGKGLLPGLTGGTAGGLNWTFIALAGLTAAILVPVGYSAGWISGDDDDSHD
ncbi:MAG: hypothetical protein GWP14_02780 [Actinobacteria bacterium]|nr:hypothetical protein [Actinomycetota bacterium]